MGSIEYLLTTAFANKKESIGKSDSFEDRGFSELLMIRAVCSPKNQRAGRSSIRRALAAFRITGKIKIFIHHRVRHQGA
jgi:hypothetical protein